MAAADTPYARIKQTRGHWGQEAYGCMPGATVDERAGPDKSVKLASSLRVPNPGTLQSLPALCHQMGMSPIYIASILQGPRIRCSA